MIDRTAVSGECERVLRSNWTVGERDEAPYSYTRPSPGRYPWQWYWDSCFAAIVWRRFDRDRARAELETLLRGGRDGTADLDLHDALWTALSTLPRRQRAMVVLRYYEDLSEAETARVMGVSVGTVKSTTSRALAKLREDSSLLTGDADDPRTTLPTGAPA